MSVAIIERLPNLLSGTSAATHNRAHLGFHYPRCDRTASECRRGLAFFVERYPEALHDPGDSYYFIERDSKVSSQQYADFCDRLGLPYERKWPKAPWLRQERLTASFRTREPCFNLAVLSRVLIDELRSKGVELLTSHTLTNVKSLQKGRHRVTATNSLNSITVEADIVVNATYALSNNVLATAGLAADRTHYDYHTTEVIVASYAGPKLPAVTVMDGPFMSVMPLAGTKNKVLIYDVVHSVRHHEEGYSYKAPIVQGTNWDKMREHGRRYFSFIDDLEYVESLWGSRPARMGTNHDSRHTRIVAHRAAPGFFSILEGKFISAPLAAQSLLRKVRAL